MKKINRVKSNQSKDESRAVKSPDYTNRTEWDNYQRELETLVSKSLCERFNFSKESDFTYDIEHLNDSLFLTQKYYRVRRDITILDSFSENEGDEIVCDEFIEWGTPVVICRKGNYYAIYRKKMGLLTPFIFTDYRAALHPQRIYVWFNKYRVSVNFTSRGVIYQLGNLFFDSLKDMVCEAITTKIHKSMVEGFPEFYDYGVSQIWCK